MNQRTFFISLLACLALVGCNRAHYRRQADRDAVELIREKENHPHWQLPEINVYVDPRSRMFDPFNPDRPPLPPDDPASHALMHRVAGKPGFPRWHKDGDTPFVESPEWLDYLEMDECGVLKLDSQKVVELGRLHSRQYQQEVEDLYLSALDVSFERFRFQTQFFAGYQTFYNADGKDRRGGGGESKSILAASTYSRGATNFPSRNTAAWTMQKSFITGADLVVGFANSLVWQFSGPDDYNGNTLIDFTLVQPLLRNSGRDRVLERLTRTERTLLSNVRAMQRYHRAFYVDLMTGRASAGTGPARGGGVLGQGLEGFTGIGGSGFGGIGGAAAGQGITGGGAAQAGAGQAGGFIGLLQVQQQIRNQEDNISRLKASLYRLETSLEEMLTTIPADREAIPRQKLQAAQARQALFVAESSLINSRNQFEGTLDAYKITLGLPPEICIELNDPWLSQFNLIDTAIKPREDQIEGVIQVVGQTNDAIFRATQEVRDENAAIIRRILVWNVVLQQRLTKLKSQMQPVEEVRRDLIETNLPRAEADLKKLRDALPRRRTELARLQKKFEDQANCTCPLLPARAVNPAVFDIRRLDELEAKLAQELERLRTQLGQYAARLNTFNQAVDGLLANGNAIPPPQLFDRIRDEVLLESQNILTDLRLDVLALELLQARARTETIELVPIDLPACKAMEIALKYRHDLMNARASLADSWRLIAFNADQLESTFDVIFSGDIGNKGSNPFNLQSSTGRLRAGFQFDAPIVRLSERNTYRQSLIEFQQARRNFYNFEDGIARSLRNTLRTIETNQINFELQRYAVLIAAEQIDLNEDIRVLRDALRQSSGATAARDSVSALADLLNAQNNFLSIWVNYEVQRQSLDLDLGTMQVDDQGVWLDPGPIGPDYAEVVDLRMPEIEGCDHVEFEHVEELAPGRVRPYQPGTPGGSQPNSAEKPGDEKREHQKLPPPARDRVANDAPRASATEESTPTTTIQPASLSPTQSSRRRRN